MGAATDILALIGGFVVLDIALGWLVNSRWFANERKRP